MNTKAPPTNPDESKPSADMSDKDKQAVSDQSSGSAKVVHEVVRLQGDEELGRPFQSLVLSGFAAGVAISASLLTEAFLRMRLPRTEWSELVVSLGYTVGFVIVILANCSFSPKAQSRRSFLSQLIRRCAIWCDWCGCGPLYLWQTWRARASWRCCWQNRSSSDRRSSPLP
jgi:hypothetical protein